MKTERWKNQSFDWLLCWNHASALIAYDTITEVYFSGSIAGTEYETYDAAKLYICSYMFINGGSSSFATSAYFDFYDESNAKILSAMNVNAYWDATANAVKYNQNVFEMRNFYFSRIAKAGYARMIFSGYKLTT